MAFIDSGKTFDKDEHHIKMRERMEKMDICQYPLRIPSNLYKKVKIKLVEDNLKLSQLLIKALEEYIKKS